MVTWLRLASLGIPLANVRVTYVYSGGKVVSGTIVDSTTDDKKITATYTCSYDSKGRLDSIVYVFSDLGFTVTEDHHYVDDIYPEPDYIDWTVT